MKRSSVHRISVTNLQDLDGVLQTSANTGCKVTIKDSSGATVLAATTMTYVTAGKWTYDAAASVFAASGAPWEVIVEVYDNTLATLRHTERRIYPDEWWT